jgi:copper(I)-binding protein
MRRLLLAAMLAVSPALARPALAQTADIQVDQPWARATPGAARSGAVYLTVTDHGAADTLTGVSTPVAGMAMIHESIVDNGVAKMRMLDGVKLEPEMPVTLKPGGMHIMLTDLQQPLRVGGSFPLTLTFAKAPPLTVTVRVLNVGSPGPAKTDAETGGMGKMDMKDMPGMKP